MPQVIVTPFPALRARLAEDRYSALAGGLQQGANLLGQGLLEYSQMKQQEREKKLAAMTVLGAKYGFGHFGPNFAAEYERLLGNGKQIFPRDPVTHEIAIPQTYEEQLHARLAELRKNDPKQGAIMDQVEAGYMKPQPSEAEQQMARDKTTATERTHQLDRESREKAAGITAGAHVKAAEIAAGKPQKYDPNVASSGMGLFKGRMYPIAKLMNRHTGELKEGARPIPLGEWKLRESIPALRLSSEQKVAQIRKLEVEVENDITTKGPALTVIKAAMAAKNPDVANKMLSAFIRTSGKSAGMSDKEIDDALATKGVFRRFSDFLFGSARAVDKANLESSGATREPTSKKTTGPRKLSTGVEVQEEEVE